MKRPSVCPFVCLFVCNNMYSTYEKYVDIDTYVTDVFGKLRVPLVRTTIARLFFLQAP